jgi:hypothetical protein
MMIFVYEVIIMIKAGAKLKKETNKMSIKDIDASCPFFAARTPGITGILILGIS